MPLSRRTEHGFFPRKHFASVLPDGVGPAAASSEGTKPGPSAVFRWTPSPGRGRIEIMGIEKSPLDCGKPSANESSAWADLGLPEPEDRPGGPDVDPRLLNEFFRGSLHRSVARIVSHYVRTYRAWREAFTAAIAGSEPGGDEKVVRP